MNIILNTKEHFEQLLDLINKLEDWQYTSPIPSISNATIGQHTRHILDCYLCLLKGSNTTVVEYDGRERDPKIEQERNAATALIQEIESQFPLLKLEDRIQIKASYSYNIYDQEEAFETTIGREFIHNLDHMIHHLALIKIGVKTAFPLVDLHPHFGIAPSTIRHLNA